MLRHPDIWHAIDRLAERQGLSPSGLARRAGLDPTTFNKSKRAGRDGKLRWPSTESIAKVLQATDTTLAEFASFVGNGPNGGGFGRNLPLIRLEALGGSGVFDALGRPAPGRWDEIPFPDLGDPSACAVEVCGTRHHPVYRDGDVLVVSPQSTLRRGDRVVVRTRRGEAAVWAFCRRTVRTIEVEPLTGGTALTIATEDLEWLARVVWASQ